MFIRPDITHRDRPSVVVTLNLDEANAFAGLFGGEVGAAFRGCAQAATSMRAVVDHWVNGPLEVTS